MGRNDTCKLVIIQIVTLLIFLNHSFSQEKGIQKEPNLPPAYLLKANFKTQVYYNYVLSDTTKIKRVYADSSVREFQRIIRYFLTIMQPDSPKDGFSKVEISIDSINYRFIEGNKVYEFTNIETSNPNVFKFDDFQTYNIPMSMQFVIVYSPYGEVARIEGERLLEKRAYIEQLKNSIPDSIWYYNWTDGLSDNRLKFIGDVIKLLYPVNPVYRDSVWYSPLELQIDGILILDTVELRATGFINNKYTIIGKFVNPNLIPKKVKFYDIKTLSFPYKLTDSSGFLEQILSAGGLVQELNIKLQLTVEVGNPFIFKENITKNLHWEMVNSYRFK
ncbi:MAG: hypothetical protein N2560_09125 [Ignavibacteria bacterium]|nr:hypothetical protein [Ignavibacteria bacterium]